MGYRVTAEVFERSKTKGGKLLILLAVAETAANEDGVAYGIDQGWRHDEPSARRRRGTIAGKARLRPETASRLIAELVGELDDELEVRTVQTGRERTLVYRAVVGIYRDLEVDYERLEKYQQFVDRPFSTPEELAMPWAARPANFSGGRSELRPDEMSGGHEGDGLTFEQRRPDIDAAGDREIVRSSTDALIGGAHEKTHGPGPSEPSLTEEEKNLSSSVSSSAVAGDDEHPDFSPVKDLVRAFASAFGRWPQTRSEWAGWSKAFKPLADAGVAPAELVAVCESYLAYHHRVGHVDVDLTPFGLTKHWQIVSQALERRFFSWMSWASEISWRLPEDEVDYLLEQARDAIVDGDHADVVAMARRARIAHADPADVVMRWVETKGWALDDEQWARELRDQLPRTAAADLRRRAQHRRHELRRDLARLRAGVALPITEAA